jgi:polyisoprenoid-binding protein YceI
MKTVLEYSTIISTAIACTLSATTYAQAIDPEKSKVIATFTQSGVDVDVAFKKFAAEVNYDPDAQNNTSAKIAVDVSSFDIGDAEYNKEVQKPEWFNTGKFPQATFVTETVRTISPTQLQANGILTIKGKSHNVVVPISVKPDGKAWSFSGELPIKRNDYNVGEGEWTATDMVADEVKIRFTITKAAP